MIRIFTCLALPVRLGTSWVPNITEFSGLSSAHDHVSALLRRHGVADLATSAMTLAMTALLAESWLAGGSDDRWDRRARSIGIFAVSATAGATLNTYVGAWALLLAAVLAFSVALFG